MALRVKNRCADRRGTGAIAFDEAWRSSERMTIAPPREINKASSKRFSGCFLLSA
jgi:hypothetical protein